MQPHFISKTEFKAHALEFLREIEATGEPIIVTDHGRPALEIRPYRQIERPPLDTLKGSVIRYDDPTEPIGADDWDAA